jgi:hypothetical protein
MSEMVLYPSLSEDGWVDNSITKADNLLSDWFVSDFSQTYLYTGAVSSLPWLIQDNNGDLVSTAKAARTNLNYYFSQYFNSVVVETSASSSTDSPSKGNLSIYVKFTDSNGKEFIVGKMLSIANMKITDIININNEGDGSVIYM